MFASQSRMSDLFTSTEDDVIVSSYTHVNITHIFTLNLIIMYGFRTLNSVEILDYIDRAYS